MELSIWNNEYPASTEYAHYYSDYVGLVAKGNVLDTLTSQMHEIFTLINTIPGDKALFAYQTGKWTIKEIIGHLIETERVFSYRALCFSRGDNSELPGMDQDLWMENNNYSSRTLSNLSNEYLAVRVATIHLFKNMTKQMISRKGVASGVEFTVRAIAFIIAGHETHHLNIIKEKYL